MCRRDRGRPRVASRIVRPAAHVLLASFALLVLAQGCSLARGVTATGPGPSDGASSMDAGTVTGHDTGTIVPGDDAWSMPTEDAFVSPGDDAFVVPMPDTGPVGCSPACTGGTTCMGTTCVCPAGACCPA